MPHAYGPESLTSLQRLQIRCIRCKAAPELDLGHFFSYLTPGQWLSREIQLLDTADDWVCDLTRSRNGALEFYYWKRVRNRFAICSQCASDKSYVWDAVEEQITELKERKEIKECQNKLEQLRKALKTNDLQALRSLRAELELVRTSQI